MRLESRQEHGFQPSRVRTVGAEVRVGNNEAQQRDVGRNAFDGERIERTDQSVDGLLTQMEAEARSFVAAF